MRASLSVKLNGLFENRARWCLLVCRGSLSEISTVDPVTQSRHFQIPPVWRAFSESSVSWQTGRELEQMLRTTSHKLVRQATGDQYVCPGMAWWSLSPGQRKSQAPQVELAYTLVLGSQIDSQVFSQVHASHNIPTSRQARFARRGKST